MSIGIGRGQQAIRWLLLVGVVSMGVGCTRVDFAGQVHLSFDDGAEPDVIATLLSTLAQYHIPASFFEVGSHLAQLPDQGRAQLATKRAAGHILGNHSFSHPHFSRLSTSEIVAELQATERLLADFTTLKVVRPPYGDDNAHVRKVFHELGYIEVLWDVQAAEYGGWEEAYRRGETHVRERFVHRILTKVRKKNGGILLLHDTSALTVASLGQLIETLQQSGFTFVSLEAMLRR
jgi:peptidoglycan-N-acetylmuramic acid deacetylase